MFLLPSYKVIFVADQNITNFQNQSTCREEQKWWDCVKKIAMKQFMNKHLKRFQQILLDEADFTGIILKIFKNFYNKETSYKLIELLSKNRPLADLHHFRLTKGFHKTPSAI